MKKVRSQKNNTCSNAAHRGTDLRKRILPVFAGLIVDRRFDIMRERSPPNNKQSLLHRLILPCKLNDSLSSSF